MYYSSCFMALFFVHFLPHMPCLALSSASFLTSASAISLIACSISIKVHRIFSLSYLPSLWISLFLLDNPLFGLLLVSSYSLFSTDPQFRVSALGLFLQYFELFAKLCCGVIFLKSPVFMPMPPQDKKL